MKSLIDQEAEIETIQPLEKQVDALNDLAWRLRYRSKPDALRLSQRAIALAQSGPFTDSPYLSGLATAMTVSGVVKMLNFDLDEAMADCIQALTLMAGLPLMPADSDVRSAICWIHLYLGDYAKGMDYVLESAKLARDLGSKDRLAYALDQLGVIYATMGDYDQCLESHMEALQLADEVDIPDLSMVLYNNAADSLYHMGRFQDALNHSLKAYNLARRNDMLREELIYASSVAESLTKLKDFTGAEQYLHDAIWKYEQYGFNQPYVYLILMEGMAELFMAQERFFEAEPYFANALAAARKHDFKDQEMLCHQLLSETYEAMNRPAEALEHYKAYHALQTNIAKVEMSRKITLYQAEARMEVARRETESYRKLNLELQHEIEERKRVEALLEELSIRDPGTNLFNRRHFSNLAAAEYDRSLRYRHPMCVLLLDLDHFKAVNDQYGHLVGDQVLKVVAEVLQSTLRDSDIVGRFGGEEFIAVLSETPAASALQTAERLRNTISGITHTSEKGSFSITTSIGIAELPVEGLDENPVALEGLTSQADKALYAAKQAGRNRVTLYTPDLKSSLTLTA